LGELARWGYEWAWGPPRQSERVDVGAIFRLIPGLLGSSSVAPGTVELIVSDGRDGEPASYLVKLGPNGASLSENQASVADARLQGSIEAWVRALSPAADRAALRATGDQRLAGTLLDALADGHRVRADEAEPESESAAAV
jgi:hypothetical protein